MSKPDAEQAAADLIAPMIAKYRASFDQSAETVTERDAALAGWIILELKKYDFFRAPYDTK